MKRSSLHVCEEMMMMGGGAAGMRVCVNTWVCEKHSLPKDCYTKPNFSSLLVIDPGDGIIF